MAPLTQDQIRHVVDELKAGGKISAIKVYRQYSGCSLRTAKEQVEALVAGQDITPGRVGTEFDGASPEAAKFDREYMDDVLNAIEAGRKLEAVKLYKEATGASLLESKSFIEQLMNELEIADPESIPQRNGCGAAMILLLTLLWALILVAF